ncbi:MAG: hypothetical protein ACXWQR_09490 [Ktedonobacterales bacterium]
MEVQTSVQQRTTQPGGQEDLLAPQSDTLGSIATGVNAAEGKQDENDAPSPAQVVGVGVLIAATAIIVGVFGAGFMRKRIEQTVRRLSRRVVDGSYDINVPLMLPVAIAEALREMLVGRRVMAPPPAD